MHGNCYGTLRSAVVQHLEAGRDVLLDVDIQGAAEIRGGVDGLLKDALVDIFLMPPSMKELERRLNKRNTESAEQLAVRLKNARTEMEHWKEYRYTILSGSPQDDLDNFLAVMRAERMRSERLQISF